ncbi:MAG: DUF937 domain-containing protein [Planctomycetia bacterium]|nr:DUF937 domain-containing protein [Planctomycetia bacterium]
MNIVDLVTSQLTGDVLGKLGGLIGANESQTRSATNAAVPALLSALSGLASTNSGADKLASAMGGLDLNMLGNLAGLLGGGQASSLGNTGGNLLGSLLGGNLSSIVGTLATFAGMQPGIMKTLLTYLAPIVLGVVAKQFTGRPDAAGIARLFSEQQGNIRNAIPRGLSLGDFTGGSTRASEPARTVGHQHEEPATAGFPAWLPLALIPLLALGWWLWNNSQNQPKEIIREERRVTEGPITVDRTAVIEREGRKMTGVVEETVELAPGVANAVRVGEDLTGLITNIGKVLGGVNDTTSAEVALPQLREFAPQIEAVQRSTDGLPAEGKSMIAKLVADNLPVIQKAIDTVLAIPGVKEILGPAITPMIETLSKLGR